MIQKSVLANGLTVLTESLPYLHSVSVGLFVGAGSRYERPYERGISHFIEHMFFKGTKRHSARELAEIVEASGSSMNAFTSKDYTCYYVKSLDEHLELAVSVLSEMITESTFADELIEKERQVILEEIKMYLDSPQELVHDLFAKSILGDHPLGQSIIGTEKTVSSFNQEMILNYLKRTYVPENMIFTIVGNVEHKSATKLVEDYLGELEGSLERTDYRAPSAQSGLLLEKKDIEQAHLVLGTDSINRNDKRKYPLHLLDTILGGSMSSRLFQSLREERGLVYSTYSFHSYYEDIGFVGVYAGFSQANYDLVTDLIVKELSSIKDNVTEEELQRAKEQTKGSLVFALESPAARMSRLARNELYHGKQITEEYVLNEINKTTLADIKELAEFHFHRDKVLSLATILPENSPMDKPKKLVWEV